MKLFPTQPARLFCGCFLKLIDPERSWHALETRIASEKDGRRRALLERVRDHMRDELRELLEPVMATLADEPVYHFHGMAGFDTLRGRPAVEAYYRQMFSAGRMNAEFVIERIAVDNDTVVTEGTMIALVAGDNVPDGALPVRDASAQYLASTPLLVVWPATADGRLTGENIYLGAARYTRAPAD
jgi:limonene-1,2-epoxide hydrolase